MGRDIHDMVTVAPVRSLVPRAALPAQLPVQTAAPDHLAPTIRRKVAIPPPPIRDSFDERTERAVLKTGGPQLVAYKSFDPLLPPVVLVHGMQGNPSHFMTLADRFRSEGRQVYMFCYDDKNTKTEESGEALARALAGLRAKHPAASGLEIVAHSYGGIVTRAALGSLAERTPRAGFDHLRVRTIDTPWQGFKTGLPNIPVLTRLLEAIVHFFFWLFGMNSAWDMRANSDMMQRLHATKLQGVDLQNITAHQAAKDRDDIRALEDMNDGDRRAVERFVRTGEMPSDERARNWCGMLADDSRLPELRAALESGRSLEDATNEIMPSITGTHMTILEDPALLEVLSPARSTPRRSPPQSP